MVTHSAGLSRLLEQAGTGQDVLLLADPAEARLLLAEAATALSGSCRIVEIRADAGPLSLSSLMAQLSGRDDLDAQDDAVLAAGYGRLTAPGQRVALLLDGVRGVQRPALRFVQHVAKSAQNLALVVAAGPDLQLLLAEPDFTGLRSRLLSAPPLALRDAPAALPASRPLPAPRLLPAETLPIPAAAAPRTPLATLSDPKARRPSRRRAPVLGHGRRRHGRVAGAGRLDRATLRRVGVGVDVAGSFGPGRGGASPVDRDRTGRLAAARGRHPAAAEAPAPPAGPRRTRPARLATAKLVRAQSVGVQSVRVHAICAHPVAAHPARADPARADPARAHPICLRPHRAGAPSSGAQRRRQTRGARRRIGEERLHGGARIAGPRAARQ